MPKWRSPLGQSDLERKFPAEEREVYEGTPSDETGIEKQNSNKIEKIRISADFQPYSQMNSRKKNEEDKTSSLILFFGYA